ncbi:MAG: GntR family transcriptional regulator [Firmicutes bacterium]|jgi:DNA-binding GntR family transcriptional regulator|nr:GntR family transcriptional regulator [Bacillota bacterium]
MKILRTDESDSFQPAGYEVFQRLRAMILDGEIPCGERLVERRLAEAMLVSRTPVREALKKLEAEGLVHRCRYGGLVVSRISPEDAIEIFRIREVLEGLATQLAATLRDEEDLEVLSDLFKKMNDAIRDRDDERFNRLNAQFHERIYAAAHSPRLYALIANVREYLRSYARIGFRNWGRPVRSNEEHRRILEELQRGDAIGAEEAARHHIRQSLEAALGVLRENAEGPR